MELASLSSYYQRYRTCELHLKAPSILKDGVQQRFCQQVGSLLPSLSLFSLNLWSAMQPDSC